MEAVLSSGFGESVRDLPGMQEGSLTLKGVYTPPMQMPILVRTSDPDAPPAVLGDVLTMVKDEISLNWEVVALGEQPGEYWLWLLVDPEEA